MLRNVAILLIAAGGLVVSSARAAETELGSLLTTIRAVGPKGAGHVEAIAAWRELAKADASQLPAVLAGLDGSNPLAANWLSAAVDAIAERRMQSGGKLPLAQLEQFVLDRGHTPGARRLAFEWLVRGDPSAHARLIPGMLDDPSLELRRLAVAREIDLAGKTALADDKSPAIAQYAAALSAARDADQIKLVTAKLKELGREVDLPRHYGFLMQWHLIGPFDNVDMKAFDVAYEPEKQIDLAAACPGKSEPVRWVAHTTADALGWVDLNKALGKNMGAIGYAVTDFTSEEERDVELRIGCDNANKIWLNGQLVSSNAVYHSGTKLDQYVARGRMKRGKNVILVKICQNEQKESWAQGWHFQLRICDETGTAILAKDRP